MWFILDSLFLGDYEDASDYDLLRKCQITHIVNCARELPDYFPSDFEYLSLGLADPDPKFIRVIENACQFIDDGRKKGNVLVHCIAAASRSPSVILAYLCFLGYSLNDAWLHIDQCAITAPDPLFIKQLRQFCHKKK